MRYDYGRKEQGTSFEFNNFFRTLERMVPIVVEFDFMSIMQEQGKERMNELLIETAAREEPDLVFFILFTDEIASATLDRVSDRFVTFNWFCDDHWRFNNFSRHYAPHLRFVSTTDIAAPPKYRKIGYENVFLTQWACNHFDYKRLPDFARRTDVSFVGQPHGNRRSWIKYLNRCGIEVEAYGNGWKNGRISQEEMIRLFNGSRINLNLSNSSFNIHTIFGGKEQIKGRNFEIPGCGGFLMTNHVAHLERYYEIGKEIVCFSGKRDLADKISFYLTHDYERESIALAGYERTIREHTYEKRFRQLFDWMGFRL